MSAAIPRQLYKPLAVAGALVFVYFAVLMKLGRDWWFDENYSHGLLIPFVIGFVVWYEWKRLTDAPKHAMSSVGLAGVILSLAMLWAGVAGAELFVQRVSLILMLVSLVIYFWGPGVLRLLIVPATLLALSIPIPQIIFNRIAFPLQLFASRCAVATMSFFSIPVLRQGNIIELMPLGATEPKKLAVVEACSGIRSLMTLITLALVYAYFTKPKSKNKAFRATRFLLLVGSAIPIAIFTNALRVSGTGVLAHYYGTGVADGFFHSFSGWVIYVLAALLLFASGWVLDSAEGLWRRSRRTTHPGPAKPKLESGQGIARWKTSQN